MTEQPWRRSYRADPAALPLADRHYNRQKIGSPQFVPPGRCLVLLTDAAAALWVTGYPYAEHVRHEWAGAMVNSLFRREAGPPASDLIRAACAATRARWEPPPLGMVTFVDPRKIRPVHGRCRCAPDCPYRRGPTVPGWSYVRAGFRHVGVTREEGLIALRLFVEDWPDPSPARPAAPPAGQLDLLAL